MAEIESESLLGASISALVGGVIGGRLYYIAFSWSQFSGKSWKILCDIRSGGMSIYGAILGGRACGSSLLPAQQNVILENGRYCMYGIAQRTDNRCMGKLFLTERLLASTQTVCLQWDFRWIPYRRAQ